MIIENNLNQLLSLVCQSYLQDSIEPFEERGGFVFQHKDGIRWKFERVPNRMTGSPQAAGLYVADPDFFAALVCGKDGLTGGWRLFASFHTHPPGYGPRPSSMDITLLFRSFPTNIIFSPDSNTAVRYDFDKINETWQPQQLKLD